MRRFAGRCAIMNGCSSGDSGSINALSEIAAGPRTNISITACRIWTDDSQDAGALSVRNVRKDLLCIT